MIDYLEGIVIEKLDNSLVISVNGVGFRVFVSRDVLDKADLHKIFALKTNLIVREESLTLYGFETSEEKELFNLLLSVSGVGPRTAMAIISTGTIENLKQAVLSEQPELLNNIPGVGKKTAQSIVLHLQGKIKGELSGKSTHEKDVDQDVITVLQNLGYSLVEAQAAVQTIPDTTSGDLETRIRAALSYFR